MPRYPGKAHEYTKPLRTLVSPTTFADAEACWQARGENQAEFVRQAIVFFILTKCLSNSTDATIQPSEGSAQ